MKKIIFISLSIIGLMSSSAFAVKEGGGGARIESAFRLRGMELISAVSESPAADSKCSSKTMQRGLEGIKIRVVDGLVNPSTGVAIVSQSLDAWTTPGDMQLTQSSWSQFFSTEKPRDGRSVDALILHEIYRSTGVCNDNNFRISDAVFQLIKLSNKYSKTYSLPVKTQISIMDPAKELYRTDAACDQDPTKTPIVTCIFFYNYGGFMVTTNTINGVPIWYYYENMNSGTVVGQFGMNLATREVENFHNFITPNKRLNAVTYRS